MKVEQKTRQIRSLLVWSLEAAALDSQNVRVLRGPEMISRTATGSVVCGPGHQHPLRRSQKCRTSGPTPDLLVTLPSHRNPRAFRCPVNCEESSLALHRGQESLHPSPVPSLSLHKCLQSWGSFFVLQQPAPSVMSNSSYLVFLGLSGNLLLYKFHTAGLVLTLGQSKAHKFFFHLISLWLFTDLVAFSPG